ncbi:MAG TPA: heavy metal translocating P-type ATPase [Terriglobia bacterium]|nr:heavy metal translocating P-type ATPase [Terriglobia bacterium]
MKSDTVTRKKTGAEELNLKSGKTTPISQDDRVGKSKVSNAGRLRTDESKASKEDLHLKKDRFSKENVIVLITLFGIGLHLALRFLFASSSFTFQLPLIAVLVLCGLPLIYELALKAAHQEFGSDLLAGISIITSAILGEYLAGSLVVLMLSGGRVMESYAVRKASSVLEALAKRMPNIAHKKLPAGTADVPLQEIAIGDVLIIHPHEICPVDGVVVQGHSTMDESYLTGEPFNISKAPGSDVLSGALNGDVAITIEATKLAVDSRYANITKVMRSAQQHRPQIRRLGDQLGAIYTPVAVAVALAAWFLSGDPIRFLAVLVIATPCPLLIAIPVSIIGSISLAAKRGIIIKDPSVLEQIETCHTIIFDKTGTLTYGIPDLSGEIIGPGFDGRTVLKLVASLEQYSKHPLARAILAAAKKLDLHLEEATEISEPPGRGLEGTVQGRKVRVTNRRNLIQETRIDEGSLPPQSTGLECAIAVDGGYAAIYRFHDAPRSESKPFIAHLGFKHQFKKVMLLSGDRESETQYLAGLVGIKAVHASKSPEEKVAIVREETRAAKTLFLGDGINDAPALMTATVGIAFGQNSDITTEAAGAVIMDASLARVDEFFHISRRMRSVALQSAIGGMALSALGMIFAASGYLPPVGGAIAQEIIDVIAIANALRAAIPPETLIDF